MNAHGTRILHSYVSQCAKLAFLAIIFYFYDSWTSHNKMKGSQTTNNDTQAIATFVDANSTVTLSLHQKTQVSPDTYIFRFQLPSPQHVVGLSPGEHIKMHLDIRGKKVSRKYTHVNDDSLRGFVDFLIKVYHPNVHPSYPLGGVFTPELNKLKINDTLDFTGPVGRIFYRGDGNFRMRKKDSAESRELHFEKLAMIAGGSGITPIWQIINAVLKNPDDHTRIWLLFANQTPQDVLMKDYFDRMAVEHASRFRVHYTVSRLENLPWNYSTGYVDQEMLSTHLPPAGDDVGVVLCGPKPMKNDACLPNLAKLGFHNKQILNF